MIKYRFTKPGMKKHSMKIQIQNVWEMTDVEWQNRQNLLNETYLKQSQTKHK
jgi:hypothetical protein